MIYKATINKNILPVALVVMLLIPLLGFSQDDSLTWDGLTRYYRTHVPTSYSSNIPTPLIIAMHGGFGSGSQLEIQSELSVKSDQEGFIVIYPDGVKSLLGIRTWNADGCCGYSQTNNIDDVGFIGNLLDSIISKYNINTDKIYATGMSNGAFMSYKLACELSHRIAAIAPVAGTMNVQNCSPTRQVPVIHFHSYLDTSVPQQGGTGTGPSNHYNPPLDSVLTVWRTNNGCNEPDTLQHDSDLMHLKWSGCTCNTNNELYLSYDGGHSWHGGQKTATGNETSKVVSANDKMWDFFKDNPLCAVYSKVVVENSIVASPNPFHNTITISVNRGRISEYTLYNSLGQHQLKEYFKKGTSLHTVQTSNLPPGVYFLVVQNKSDLLTIKVVKH